MLRSTKKSEALQDFASSKKNKKRKETVNRHQKRKKLRIMA